MLMTKRIDRAVHNNPGPSRSPTSTLLVTL